MSYYKPLFSSHVAEYWRAKARLCRELKKWLAYEFYRQWAVWEETQWPTNQFKPPQPSKKYNKGASKM
jgi:hypothetical protein